MRRLAPQFWQKATPARLWVPQRGHAIVPSGVPGRSTVGATPAATSRCPQLRQKANPGRFSVPQRGHWVLSPTSVAAGTLCAGVVAPAVTAVSSSGVAPGSAGGGA